MVAEERLVEQQVSLSGISDGQIRGYLDAGISEKVKDALRGCLKRRVELNETVRQKRDQEDKRNQIQREQARIRENMARLEKDSDLFLRYVRLLGEQEDLLSGINRTIDQLAAKESRLRQGLTSYILSLEVE